MPFEDKKILVIDDTESIRTFLRISLETEGAEFFEAETAEKGLETARSTKPDLVVLDLGLPDRDGLDILPEIKQQESAPKVIILSVRKDQKTKNKAFDLKADGYVTKPFMMDELIEEIEEQLT